MGVSIDVDGPEGKFAVEAEAAAAKRSRPDETGVNKRRVVKAVVAVEVTSRWPTNRGGGDEEGRKQLNYVLTKWYMPPSIGG